jgi:hypothetical protein
VPPDTSPRAAPGFVPPRFAGGPCQDRYADRTDETLSTLTNASAPHSIAVDKLTNASAPHSIAADKLTNVSGPHSTAVGKLTNVPGTHSIAVDKLTIASGTHSIAVDALTIASESLSIAIGSPRSGPEASSAKQEPRWTASSGLRAPYGWGDSGGSGRAPPECKL